MKQLIIQISTSLIFFLILQLYSNRNGFEDTIILGIALIIGILISAFYRIERELNDRK